MELPLEISYHNIEKNDKIDDLIRRKADKLPRFHNQLSSCRVVVELDQKRHQTSNPYRVRIDLTVPPSHELAVIEKSNHTKSQLHLASIVRRAFKAAERQLKELKDKQEQRIKKHPEQEITGIVSELSPETGTGTIRSISDNREISFTRDDMLSKDYDRLEPGTGVRFSEEMDDEGLFRATTVEIVDKPAARLKHVQ